MSKGYSLKRFKVLLLFSMLILNTAFSQVINLSGRWKFHVGDDQAWASPTFNDSDWEMIRVPGPWEDQGFNGYDGFAWYRIKFDGRKLSKDGVHYLNLGFIDDADEAFLNNNLIGFSGQCPPKFKTAYNNERKYVLPSQYINFNGDNTIAIRVFDGMHSGGIVDGEVGIYRIDEGAKLLIDLQGIWMFAKSKNGERVTSHSEWSKIMVPGAWEFQGHSKYDGFAWYKRSFTVPANFTKEAVVLILGKIDDFDKVYLNGKLIGSTKDFESYGSSGSYMETRVYEIPQQLLKRNGSNLLEVLIEDMGNVGGIYEGVIGITTKTNYQKYFD
ncbi:MAG TPA: beta galactosidase jelly roll domain-containing protein [Cyclobacteriaceae bacterium]